MGSQIGVLANLDCQSRKDPDCGTRWIPTQHVAVRQLYVLGLYVQGHEKPLYKSVFAQPIEVSALA